MSLSLSPTDQQKKNDLSNRFHKALAGEHADLARDYLKARKIVENPGRKVVQMIKNSIRNYVRAFNLKGLTTKVRGVNSNFF